MIKLVSIGLVLLLVVSFLIFKSFSGGGQSGPVTLIYWDFWDENSIRPILTEFEKTHPNTKITYISQSKINYRLRVNTQIKEGLGPDVFPIHNSWLPMFSSDLAAAPANVFTIGEYKNTFYPVAADSFIAGNLIYALPLGIDGLALYVNEDILASSGVQVPKSWSDFIPAATKLTVKDSNGQIKTAGASIGTTENIDYWSDLLGLMLLQQQTIDLKVPASPAGAEVATFYTSFVIDPSKKVWDVTLPSSTEMFTTGRLAFYFATYEKAAEIKAANPNLKFKIVPVPELPGRNIGWASFWGEAVSVGSTHQEQAWELVKFLTSKEISKVFASPNGRVDVAPEQIDDPVMGAFIAQGPYYKFWYMAEGGTDGGGINDGITKAWKDGINQILAGQSVGGSLTAAASEIKKVLDQYSAKPPPSGQAR